jgi:hypothetical protein
VVKRVFVDEAESPPKGWTILAELNVARSADYFVDIISATQTRPLHHACDLTLVMRAEPSLHEYGRIIARKCSTPQFTPIVALRAGGRPISPICQRESVIVDASKVKIGSLRIGRSDRDPMATIALVWRLCS